MNAEQRASVRKRTFLKGRIVFNNGSNSMDCLVRDLSEIGARLELSETMTLPEVFNLYVHQKDTTFRSTLRWREANAIGVTFGQSANFTSKPLSGSALAGGIADGSMGVLLSRLADLEAENAALRSLLASMSQSPSNAN